MISGNLSIYFWDFEFRKIESYSHRGGSVKTSQRYHTGLPTAYQPPVLTFGIYALLQKDKRLFNFVLPSLMPMSNEGIDQKNKKEAPKCPRCKAITVNRTPRPFSVRLLLFWLPLKRYSCYRCSRKFYLLGR